MDLPQDLVCRFHHPAAMVAAAVGAASVTAAVVGARLSSLSSVELFEFCARMGTPFGGLQA